MNLMFYSVWPEIRYWAHKLIRPLLTEVRAEGCFHSGKFYWKSWCDPPRLTALASVIFKKSSLLFQRNLFLLQCYNKMNVRFHMTSSVIFKCRAYIFLVSAEVRKKTSFARALHNSGFWYRWVVKVYTLTIKWLG